MEEGFTDFDLAFGEVPTAVTEDEEHGSVGGGDDAAGGTDVARVTLQQSQKPQRNIECVIFIA